MSDSELFHLLALQLTTNLGSKSIHKLLQHYGNPEDVFRAKAEELTMVTNRSVDWVQTLPLSLKLAEQEWQYIQGNGIRLLAIFDQDYPALLRQCPDAPGLLFCKGNLPKINKYSTENIPQIQPTVPILGVVGTRDATIYGTGHTERILSELLSIYPQMQVVSGLAKGIDIAAHKTCLNLNACTIGVIAHGFEYLFPSEHKFWANKMLEEGAIISEYPSFVKPSRERFPARNRIIAGMSEALFIAETKAKGGAMITANLGLQYNREVFALPGDISREQSLGCHLLIASHKARIFVDVPNMIATMNWDLQYPTNKRLSSQSASKSSKTSYHSKTAIAKISEHNIQTKQQLALSNLDAELQETYAKLQPSPIHFDELLDSLAYPYAKLSHNLLELELLGLVKSLPGNLYVLID